MGFTSYNMNNEETCTGFGSLTLKTVNDHYFLAGSVAGHHHHRHHHNEQLSDRHSSLRALLLLLALSLHSLFEGLALGLLKSNDAIISIFSALIVRFERSY